MTSSKPKHLSKGPPPNTITLGGMTLTYRFWGDANMPSIMGGNPESQENALE